MFKSLQHLKGRIPQAFAQVTVLMLDKTWKELLRRLKMLTDNRGSHVEVYYWFSYKQDLSWYQHKMYEIIITTLLLFIIIIKRTLFALLKLFLWKFDWNVTFKLFPHYCSNLWNTHVHEICNCLSTNWQILKSKPNMKMCHLQLLHTFRILEKY